MDALFSSVWFVPPIDLLPAVPASWAYLDPGSGSMLIQLLLGGTGGLVVLFRTFRHKLTGLFGRAAAAESSATASDTTSLQANAEETSPTRKAA